MSGVLAIDLADGSTRELRAWDMFTIPAGTIHRTRAIPRAVNLTFAHSDAATFVDAPDTGAAPDTQS